jgi:hypothetical protein
MGLFRSDDRGDHRADLAIRRYSPLTYARDVRVSPRDPRRYYAAFSIAAVSDAGSLWRSDDGAQSWRPAPRASTRWRAGRGTCGRARRAPANRRFPAAPGGSGAGSGILRAGHGDAAGAGVGSAAAARGAPHR